ncbi:hypothetical protein NXT3_PC00110 (plasmid) [Sinorhizobium fredii]|uniref:Uncharacterized protein n=1 Tax=Rhizobium fredii TaxID=380 RepID=A0A2L0HCR0_RHIFR|nr:hypothetical protein NXT3_PC00110 [Sinorhizobium fredii]
MRDHNFTNSSICQFTIDHTRCSQRSGGRSLRSGLLGRAEALPDRHHTVSHLWRGPLGLNHQAKLIRLGLPKARNLVDPY